MSQKRNPSKVLGKNKFRQECLEITPFSWYFGKMRRIEAEKLLLLPLNDHGSFLIRDSVSSEDLSPIKLVEFCKIVSGISA